MITTACSSSIIGRVSCIVDMAVMNEDEDGIFAAVDLDSDSCSGIVVVVIAVGAAVCASH